MPEITNPAAIRLIRVIVSILYLTGVLLIAGWLLYITFNNILGFPPPVPFLQSPGGNQ